MALHHSVFSENEGIFTEKKGKKKLLFQIHPIVLMTFLFYTYLGVRQKTVVLGFALCLKLDSLWLQHRKERASFLAPLMHLEFYI